MNKLFILIYLVTLSTALSACNNASTDTEVYHEKLANPSSSSSKSNTIPPTHSEEIQDNTVIDLKKVEKVIQKDFPESQLLSIKSDNYYGKSAIRVTSRIGATRKEIIYNSTLDKKLDNYNHYDKHYDENKKINLINIISLNEAIDIGAKAINHEFNIDEWKLTFEDDEQAIVWEIEDKDFEVQLNAQTGEVYDIDS